MENFVSVIEAVNFNDNFGFMFNPDFIDSIPMNAHDAIVAAVLETAFKLLENGESIAFNYTPYFDMILTISVADSGLIKIDAGGSTPMSNDELKSIISFIINSMK